MTTAATTFAPPPERRRCGRTFRTVRRPRLARSASDRPPSRTAANAHDRPPSVRMRIDFAVEPSFPPQLHRHPDRPPKGGTA
ncbi:hypothetical protein K3N28_16910 [Glycomyces sp. TRM65418]|uniref:hypothetical protein n=1 Tax=Glycomyces sp. TRM65418 TaxID=2867006 RepID=UPI001CE65E47|nr:hypothetical protein [Glycomyces sp. TRM65418]MCC3764739.1 hypothetical protein [Glycomyces sp. TRM65418]QZD54396.1 hypothetical protein K3N28_16825 [Glycomyces sp. TRM65418]